MSTATPTQSQQLVSLITRGGTLEVRLDTVPLPAPQPDDLIVRIEAAPINPSDLGLLLGAADLSTLEASGTAEAPVLRAQVPAPGLRAMAGRLDQVLPVGNEGAGTVIAAGNSPAAQALIGRRVASIGGAMYAQFRCLPLSQCLVLPDSASAIDRASAFVNPLGPVNTTEVLRRRARSTGTP